MKDKINLKNVLYYIQGNIRYRLFYSKFAFLINKYIKEQIEMRINSMDSICYKNGECKICGCQTTHLQMCNKACNKPCYPKILPKKDWNFLKKTDMYFEKNSNILWTIDKKLNIFKGVKL